MPTHICSSYAQYSSSALQGVGDYEWAVQLRLSKQVSPTAKGMMLSEKGSEGLAMEYMDLWLSVAWCAG